MRASSLRNGVERVAAAQQQQVGDVGVGDEAAAVGWPTATIASPAAIFGSQLRASASPPTLAQQRAPRRRRWRRRARRARRGRPLRARARGRSRPCRGRRALRGPAGPAGRSRRASPRTRASVRSRSPTARARTRRGTRPARKSRTVCWQQSLVFGEVEFHGRSPRRYFRGRPRMRSAMMLRWISLVPA